MPVQIPDAVLLMLPAAAAGLAAGLAAGYGLSAWVAHRRRSATSAQRQAAPPDGAGNGETATGAPRPVSQTPIDPARPQVAAQAPAADLLLVDDSAVARAKLRRLFETAGYKVHLASDGIEALALLEKGHYGLLITDLEMPNMDGVTLINTCLSRPQTASMPILAISGHESLRAKFSECRDICGIHRKPWVDDILLSHAATLVGVRPRRTTTAAATPAADHPA
jgi:CheY-like chemotaxis protein